MSLIVKYKEHEKDRAKLGVPSLALTTEQTTISCG